MRKFKEWTRSNAGAGGTVELAGLRRIASGLALVAATALATPATAAVTVLTFNSGEVACAGADGAAATQACTTSGVTGTPQYIGSDYGSSAVLSVSYDAGESDYWGSRTSLHFNTDSGGVATPQWNPPADELSSIYFTPAAGYEVSFLSFDWVALTATTSADFIFRVLDPLGAVLFEAGNSMSSYTVNTAYFAGPLTFQFGNGGRGAVGVDNLAVDVRAVATGAIPEPATWAMMIMGFAGSGALLRRRARRTGVCA